MLAKGHHNPVLGSGCPLLMRLAIVASHPIQYHAPLFRELAKRLDLMVFFSHRATPTDQAKAGFGVPFDWDVDLLSGYAHTFLRNIAKRPGLDRFGGCDTPEIGERFREGRFDCVLVQGWYLKSFSPAGSCGEVSPLAGARRGHQPLESPPISPKTPGEAAVFPPFLTLVRGSPLG